MARVLPVALSLGLTSVVLGSLPAHAQATCAPRDQLVERLQSGYGEALTGGGLQSETRMIEVYSSKNTGTWTVVMTQADGFACIMASGTNWHALDPTEPVKGIPG